jgi:four helix bundle protein
MLGICDKCAKGSSDQGSGIRDQGSGIRDREPGIGDRGSGTRDGGSGLGARTSRYAGIEILMGCDTGKYCSVGRCSSMSLGRNGATAFLHSAQECKSNPFDSWMPGKLGMAFVLEVYRATDRFPDRERYGLTAQLRRAAISIPSNVAEGHQLGTKSYRRSVRIALGSLAEAETQLELSRALRLASEQAVGPLFQRAGELGRVLHGLDRALRRRQRERVHHSRRSDPDI